MIQDVENVLLVDGGPNLERFDVELLELDAVELELVVRNLLLRCLRCRLPFFFTGTRGMATHSASER